MSTIPYVIEQTGRGETVSYTHLDVYKRQDNIHTVLHQVLQIAVDDDFIRNNPSDNVLRELKKTHCFQSEKRRALTKPEQELFLNFLKTHPVYEHWYPVFAVMIGTGLRVGEVTGLRWCDIDMELSLIHI